MGAAPAVGGAGGAAAADAASRVEVDPAVALVAARCAWRSGRRRTRRRGGGSRGGGRGRDEKSRDRDGWRGDGGSELVENVIAINRGRKV